MKNKLLARNTYTSLLYQVVTVACGFVLPKLILVHYGTAVNGLVNSITQFLGLITYLDLGISAVVQSALYKPLAEKNNKNISEIISSARKFFKTIARILAVYVVILIFIYPFIIQNSEFDIVYTGTLIVAISISSFAQYYFGITDQLLISADQRVYIPYMLQIITLIVNTITCAILMSLGHSIQLVKLTTSLIFLVRPLYYRIYVNKHYNINRNAHYEKEPIQQKWNGIAQHVAAVVIGGTDTVVLTLFSTLQNVSIYGVYYLVINGVQKIFVSATTGFQSFYGDLWAKGETEKLRKSFESLVWTIHTSVVFVFGCVAVLIVPFVKVYTFGVNDADYDVPLFALLITLAYAVYCIRLPYNLMVLAGNHYKQTQKSYIIATALNIVVSVITVKIYGLIGVAAGTLISMLYQTIWMAYYNDKYLVQGPFKEFVKQTFVDVISFVPPYVICLMYSLNGYSYTMWVILAVKVAVTWIVWIVLVNFFCYRSKLYAILGRLTKKKMVLNK